MTMATRLLLVLFFFIPTLITGQKYPGGGSMASFYPYDLADDENGDRGGGIVQHYGNKNDDHDDDDDYTSHEVKPWKKRFNLLNTDLDILNNMRLSEKRRRLADSIAMTLKRNRAYDPATENDEDDMENGSLKRSYHLIRPQPMRRIPQIARRRQSLFNKHFLIDSFLNNKEYHSGYKRYWDKSCNCWKWVENIPIDRRRYSINMPLSILSWVVENAQKEEDMAKTKQRLLGLGR